MTDAFIAIDVDPCPRCKRSPDALTEEENWPLGGPRDGQLRDELGRPFGQISGVSMATNGDVVIFHRSSRPWAGEYV